MDYLTDREMEDILHTLIKDHHVCLYSGLLIQMCLSYDKHISNYLKSKHPYDMYLTEPGVITDCHDTFIIINVTVTFIIIKGPIINKLHNFNVKDQLLSRHNLVVFIDNTSRLIEVFDSGGDGVDATDIYAYLIDNFPQFHGYALTTSANYCPRGVQNIVADYTHNINYCTYWSMYYIYQRLMYNMKIPEIYGHLNDKTPEELDTIIRNFQRKLSHINVGYVRRQPLFKASISPIREFDNIVQNMGMPFIHSGRIQIYDGNPVMDETSHLSHYNDMTIESRYLYRAMNIGSKSPYIIWRITISDKNKQDEPYREGVVTYHTNLVIITHTNKRIDHYNSGAPYHSSDVIYTYLINNLPDLSEYKYNTSEKTEIDDLIPLRALDEQTGYMESLRELLYAHIFIRYEWPMFTIVKYIESLNTTQIMHYLNTATFKDIL